MEGGDGVKSFPVLFLCLTLFVPTSLAAENEVIREPIAKVYIPEHPQTGKQFVSIRAEGDWPDPFEGFVKREIRPDYKMLEAHAKGIPYEGPVSDRTKVYVFAATIATLGVAGSVIAGAAFPAAAGTTCATGGTGLLGATGVAVGAGTAATAAYEMNVGPGEEEYTHASVSAAEEGDPKRMTFREVLQKIDSDASGAES